MISLTALTVPAITNYQKKQAENEEIKNFVSSFRTSQNLALTTDTTYKVTFQNNQVQFCPSLSTTCKIVNLNFLTYSGIIPINIDRYGNLVDNSNVLISQNEIQLTSTNFLVQINKYGRIYVKAK